MGTVAERRDRAGWEAEKQGWYLIDPECVVPAMERVAVGALGIARRSEHVLCGRPAVCCHRGSAGLLVVRICCRAQRLQEPHELPSPVCLPCAEEEEEADGGVACTAEQRRIVKRCREDGRRENGNEKRKM